MSSPLVSVDWLADRARDAEVRVLDVRWYLGGARTGRAAYDEGHLPGAHFVDLDRELAAPPGAGPGRHPLPTAASFQATLARLGVTRTTIVVAYDDAGGAIAARLWWLLRWFGLGTGRVLDGGIGAWVARGLPLTKESLEIAPAPVLDLAPGGVGVADRARVAELSRDPAALVLDARATERFEGKLEPVDARPGHVPFAVSAPFTDNLVGPGGAFLPASALRARYEALGAFGAREVVCYCGSGVTACHDLLALALAGRDDALLYPGSWSDWAADPSLPAALGPGERS